MATVLVIDDRATNREFARATLDLGGYRVLEASGGREGLATARKIHPDVVVVDVLMPGMDGYEFVQQLRAERETWDIPVLMYTANYRPDEAEPLAEAYGVTKVLTKSADPDELLAAVEHALHDRPVPSLECDSDLLTQHLKAVNAKLLEKVHALDESEARFVTIAELSPVGIVVGGTDMLAAYVNPRLGQITQRPTGDLHGHGWLQCIPPEHRDNVATTVRQATAPLRFYGQIHLPSGQARWLNVHIGHMDDSEQRRVGFVATIDDVTPMIEAEERRHVEEREREEQARRRVTERFDSLARLCGGVAHDFNNLLNIIMSFTDFAAESITDATGAVMTEEAAQAIRADLQQIGHTSKRAAHLTHQLLTFGGREIVQPTVIGLNALVEEVCGMIDGTIGRHIAIVSELDPEVRNARADSAQLSQVLLNLALNAREAMPNGGQLGWRTGNITKTRPEQAPANLPPGEYVHLAVVDNGEGMAPEVVEQAIEPFFTTKPKGHGTGLGLATAYGVVKQAGGDLAIESTPGQGTTVHIYLPATDEPLKVTNPAATTHAPTGQTILIAEDEDGVREVASRILGSAGYQILTASNGEDALAVVRRHGAVDALVTDVVMPRMNGPELVRALHDLHPATPVLYMSGFAAPLMTAQGILEPGVTVLSKPFTKRQLLDALHATLARHALAAP